MKDCKRTNRNLVAFLYGELNEQEKEQVKAHLDSCPACAEELRQWEEVYKAADSLNADMARAMAAVDWDKLPGRIAGRVHDGKPEGIRPPRRAGLGGLLWQPRFRFAYVGLLLGIIVGAVATFLIFRTPSLQIAESGRISVPQGFYDMMELEIARRDTIDYLDRSEYLLLDFIQSSPEKSVEFWKSDYASRRARDLLSKKKYIDSRLNSIQLAKAKAICDQIELLFFELMNMTDQLGPEELQRIQRFIEDRQLLLKIKLIRKDLQKDEV